jgi:hypothetical protein
MTQAVEWLPSKYKFKSQYHQKKKECFLKGQKWLGPKFQVVGILQMKEKEVRIKIAVEERLVLVIVSHRPCGNPGLCFNFFMLIPVGLRIFLSLTH